jgi:predicted CopG family antitoxin
MKTICINEEVWEKLIDMKKNLKFKRINDVLIGILQLNKNNAPEGSEMANKGIPEAN